MTQWIERYGDKKLTYELGPDYVECPYAGLNHTFC